MGLFSKSPGARSGVVMGLREPGNEEAVLSRKLAHIRTPGMGDPGWPGDVRYIIPGVSPTFPVTDGDSAYAHGDPGLGKRVYGGALIESVMRDPKEGTITRQGRTSAFSNSLPAAQFFQGFANVRWSGMLEGFGLLPRPLVNPGSRALTQMGNPGAFGSKELHRATTYNPFPPMGSIIPKAL